MKEATGQRPGAPGPELFNVTFNIFCGPVNQRTTKEHKTNTKKLKITNKKQKKKLQKKKKHKETKQL